MIEMQEFLKSIKDLESAFRVMPCTEATIDLYFSKLKTSNLKQFKHAITDIIENENFFPSVYVIKKYLSYAAPVRNEAIEILDRMRAIQVREK